MSPSVIHCPRCGGPLAPADVDCAACGEPVPVAGRAAVLGERAEALAREGNYEPAARSAGAVLALPLEPAQAKAWHRKRGAWLQRLKRPGALEEAEADLRAAVALDDGDDLGHQLWVDLLHRLGRLDQARAEYRRRLERDPEDAVAKRHLASLRLMDDLRTAPVPTLNLPPQKQGFFMRLIQPNPAKMAGAAVGVISCLAMLGGSLGHHGKGAAQSGIPAGLQGLGPIAALAADPWLNALQVVLYSAYIYWGWRTRRGA